MTPASLFALLSNARRALCAAVAVVLLLLCAGAPAGDIDFPEQERSSVLAGAELEPPQPELSSPGLVCAEGGAPLPYLAAKPRAGSQDPHESVAAAPPLRPPRA